MKKGARFRWEERIGFPLRSFGHNYRIQGHSSHGTDEPPARRLVSRIKTSSEPLARQSHVSSFYKELRATDEPPSRRATSFR